MLALIARIADNDSLTHRIAILEQELQLLKEKVALSNDIISQSNDTICNELTATNNYFTTTSIIVAIMAVVLGVYLTYIANKVKKTRDNAREQITEATALLKQISEKETSIGRIEENILRMQQDVKNLDRNIRTDISGISELIRKEDTAALLDRLVEIPEDIDNVSNMLLARDIDQALFPKMKQAYIKFKSSDEFENDKMQYHLLFFQHFCGSTMCDDELSGELRSSMEDCFERAFSIDMTRSTGDLVQKLADHPDKDKAITILTDYISRVESSKHAANKEIYKIITEGTPNATLKTIWGNLSGREPRPVNFGKQFIRHFSPNDDPAFVHTVALSLGLSHEHHITTPTEPEEDNNE